MLNGMNCIGKVVPSSAEDIAFSRIGLGFEKLDRFGFDPGKAYDKAAATGAKWIRIQSGWQRTETAKGVYSFEWLDDIVDNLIRRGMTPWMCLCYGNKLYDPAAAGVFGAVGCPPLKTAEAREAWSAYVEKTATRYAGKIEYFEVWNEPDGEWCWKHGPSGTEYGELVKITSAAVKRGNPSAKVIGGSMCLRSLKWLNDMLRTGAGGVIDAFTFHEYTPHEKTSFSRIHAIRALCRKYNPSMEIIQGETGAQSRSDGCGAMSGFAWTPYRQARFMARRMMSDMLEDLKFSSYFSCLDMAEALNGSVNDIASRLDFGYFGILGAEFDADGRATGAYSPKPAYVTLQTIASAFRGEFSPAELPIDNIPWLESRSVNDRDDLLCDCISGGFARPDGSAAFVYWKPLNQMTAEYESTISFEFAELPDPVRLVDVVTGKIYAFDEKMLKDSGNGHFTLEHIPLTDSPLLLTFGGFIAKA